MRSRGKLVWAVVATLLLSAGVYLVGNASVALFDRDEPRYAECSREMLRGSPEHPGPNFIVPRYLGELRTTKPPGIYWLQAGAMRLLGDTAFAARLPSAIGMVLVLLLWAMAVWRLAGPRRAAWAVFILATCMMTIVSAKACLTDAVLLVFVTLAQLCLYAIYRGRRDWKIIVTMGIAIGLAGLIKGPVVLGVQGMTILALMVLQPFAPRRPTMLINIDPERQFLWTCGKTLAVFLLVAAIVGPWLFLINRAAPGFLPASIGHDVVARIGNGLEGHSAPPGYHLVTIWGMYFPWSILLPMTFVFAFKRKQLPIMRFSIAATLGPWIMFECVKTKLPHYLLPIYPWLALMTADAIVRCLRYKDEGDRMKDENGGWKKEDDLLRPFTINAMTAWGALVILVGLAPWGFLKWFRPIPVGPTMAFTVTALIVGISIIIPFRRRKPLAGLLCLGLGNFVLVAVIFGVYLPRVPFLRTPILVADKLKQLGATAPGSVKMLDFKEPSLAFYQGGTIRESSNTILTPELAARTPAYLVITDDVWKASPPDARALYDVIGDDFPTLSYADSMRRIRVMIVHRKITP